MAYISGLETKIWRYLLLHRLRENYNCLEFFDGGHRIIGQTVVKLLRPSKIGQWLFSGISVAIVLITNTHGSGHGG